MSQKRSFNPFAGLPNKREVFAWGMYDLANQSFTLLINTLLFSIYVKKVIVHDEKAGDRWWAIMTATSLFIVVLLSPVLGALADARRWRKEMLIATGLICSLLTTGLALTGADTLILALLLYIPANICFELGENFLASFLPDVSTPRNIGKISALGWTMGYSGAILLMVCLAVGTFAFGLTDAMDWRPFFVFAGLWFFAAMLPAMFILREQPREVERGHNVLAQAFGRLAHTVRDASRFKHLVRFLIAFFVYGFGVQTMIKFSAIIATDFGVQEKALVFFALQISVTAGLTTFIVSKFQDRVGARAIVIAFLGVWIGVALALLWMTTLTNRPQWLFWIVGNGIGIGLGGIGTSSRSMVGVFTPKNRAAEFFGLWGMSYKLAGAIGVLSFGLVKAWLGNTNAMILLTTFFAVGLVLMLPVSEKQGMIAKHRAERIR
ncbi:MAG: MFS transporter [Phycisphaeraceae bacterium]|nr:MFS transporter [Phycisphaerales bacterium]MCB9861582.1 MFS transporter [Phycisphaeraceae bacterium]